MWKIRLPNPNYACTHISCRTHFFIYYSKHHYHFWCILLFQFHLHFFRSIIECASTRIFLYECMLLLLLFWFVWVCVFFALTSFEILFVNLLLLLLFVHNWCVDSTSNLNRFQMNSIGLFSVALLTTLSLTVYLFVCKFKNSKKNQISLKNKLQTEIPHFSFWCFIQKTSY